MQASLLLQFTWQEDYSWLTVETKGAEVSECFQTLKHTLQPGEVDEKSGLTDHLIARHRLLGLHIFHAATEWGK